jgi:predicted AAA+ superfamily ATPase
VATYFPRALDGLLADALTGLSAIAVDGPKGVGKTATASRLAKSIIELDREDERQALAEDPTRIERLARPALIDEWQLYPSVWDQVRRAVDHDPSPGRFILTGSATPVQSPKHSGAGRIVHLRMRPFSLAERLATAQISLAELMGGARPPISGTCDLAAPDYAEEVVKGGFPALRAVPPQFRQLAWSGYLDEVLNRELPELGRPVRRRDTLRAWLRSYAGATCTTASYTDILDNAMAADADKPTKATTLAWREALGAMWLLDPLPPWDDPLRRLGRLGQVPKHQLADPALAAHLLGLSATTLLSGPKPGELAFRRPGTAFGALFESLVTLSIRVYAQLLGARTSHLRTRNGDHEVDVMVTKQDGRALAIEIKSAPTVTAADVKHLRWLQDKLGDSLSDSLIVNTGQAAYRRSADGIAVVPAALLGP